MKKLIIFTLLCALIISLCSCASVIDRDLEDGKCDTCGGLWHYSETLNFLGDTYYYYKCDNCGKEIRTQKWGGKL